MDLLDFDAGPLYFDQPLAAEVSDAIRQASEHYPEPEAEALLLKAQALAPEHLEVIVALYRFYFYQNRLDDADRVADQALALSAAPIGYPTDWRQLKSGHVRQGIEEDAGLARFWLLALKAKAVLALRQLRIEDGIAMLSCIADVDERDRIGTRGLIEVARIHASDNVIPVDFAGHSA
jgi:tetratricopeptide (TPR) repeat protein